MRRNPYTDRTWWTVVVVFHAIPAVWWFVS